MIFTGGAVASFYPHLWSYTRGFLGSPKPQLLQPRSPEEDRLFLEQRVKEYWQARIESNPSLSFQYEHPVQQQRIGERKYNRRIGSAVRVKEFSILDVKLHPEGDKADIRLGAKYTYKFNIPGAKPLIVSTEIADYWQKEAGIWYHVLDTKVIPNGRPVITNKATSAG